MTTIAPDRSGLGARFRFEQCEASKIPSKTKKRSFVHDLVAAHLSSTPYKAPRQVVILDAMPRTHLGKIDRGKLRKLSSTNA